ncbi:hypothetical protein OUZ56_031133 [Daphnia magna]|uniref:Uncharacterized protein n=1 Tax=Daphnia magna TaxID=35525 RepID=A0ABQ9ZTC6_9CRUS|nr:hypothetical protein OUZ56_031133 [Daphnia magna]
MNERLGPTPRNRRAISAIYGVKSQKKCRLVHCSLYKGRGHGMEIEHMTRESMVEAQPSKLKVWGQLQN